MTANRPRNTSNQACTVWRAGFAWLLLVALFAAAPATAVDQNAAQPDNNDDADISNLEDIYRIELVVFADTAAIAQQANSRDAGPEQETGLHRKTSPTRSKWFLYATANQRVTQRLKPWQIQLLDLQQRACLSF